MLGARSKVVLLMGLVAAWVLTPTTQNRLHAAPQQPSASALSDSSPASAHRAVLNKYCVTCHNEKLKTAGLTLDTMDVTNVGAGAPVWEKVVRKLRGGMMPPIGLPRPDERTYNAVASWLETELDRAAAAKPNPGRPDALRRLNRTEYRNAIRDLLMLEIDVTDLLPTDDSSNGFDNISLGGLDPGRLERYLSAAQKISRVAVGAPFGSPVAETVVVPSDLPQDSHMDGLPFGTRGGALVRHNFPLDAEYSIKIALGQGFSNGQVAGLTEPHKIAILLDGTVVQQFTVVPPVRPNRQSFTAAVQDQDYTVGKTADADLNVRVPVKAGARSVGVAFLTKGSRLIEKQREPFLKPHVTVGEDQRTQPTVYSVTITGPFDASGPGDTPSRRHIFSCRPANGADEDRCVKQILSTLARRAYRRPVTDADLQVLRGFYDEGRAAGGFEAGIERALRRLLVSPEFLFRVERDPAKVVADTPYRITDLELASRLSFFLWSSIPDDELLDLASRGRLKDPAVLEKQVRRMLADPRSETLVSNFAAQWLYLRNLPSVRPDFILFPDFDESLRRSMRKETELLFDSIIREDRSVLDLLRADYTFLDERLAKHYGIPNVYGSHFRRVELGPNSVRGGLLGQGSILTVTAYANRTAPVIRGKWILTNILGTPPPNPPPNVPPLSETKSATVLSMRERMVQHRANPVCASCHKMMDPIGLALENFDAVGHWRTTTDAFVPLDVSGGLPDGSTFEGGTGLKKALLSRPEQFVKTLTEKLLTFGLGRGVEYYDAPAVRKIVHDSVGTDYSFSSLIVNIVKSSPFQMRTPSPSQPAAVVAAR